jgi:hypothetical protein
MGLIYVQKVAWLLSTWFLRGKTAFCGEYNAKSNP